MKNSTMRCRPWFIPVTLACLLLGLSLHPPANAAEEEEVTDEDNKAAIYIKFHPNFVVNLKDNTSNFLMVTVQGMSREQRGINLARQHMGAIRHQLLMVLSEQTSSSIRSLDGKKALQAQALTRIQELMTQETGKPRIEAVLFTDFVLE